MLRRFPALVGDDSLRGRQTNSEPGASPRFLRNPQLLFFPSRHFNPWPVRYHTSRGGPLTERRPFKTGRFLRTLATSLWLILAVALALRLGFAWGQVHSIPERILSTYSFLVEPGNIAYSLAVGKGFSSPFRVDTGPTAWMTPAYPLILASVFRVFGTYTFASYIAAISLNILFSTLTCLPLFYCAKRVAALRVAAGATWLWAIFPNAIIIPTGWIWDTSLSALLAATILWATLALAQSGRARDWIGYGLLWGLALMTNPTLASLLPFLLGWLAWRTRREGRLLLLKPTLAAGVMVLCCAPWTIRNYAVFKSFVPLRSVMGLQWWMGNNEGYRDRFPGWLHPINNTTERAQYVRMGEIAYMQEKKREAIQFILHHPRQEARLCYARFVSTWVGTDHPIRDFLRDRTFAFRISLIANLLTTIGVILGAVFLFRRRSAYAFPIVVFPVVFPLVFYVTQALFRYRHPIDPVILLVTAVAIQELLRLAPLATGASWTEDSAAKSESELVNR